MEDNQEYGQSESGYARHFLDLKVYQKARSVTFEIFGLTKSWPKEETYSLIDQVRRSSMSIGANIAEAWGKRRYEKHFISKLTDSDGEQLETQHWLAMANDCEYISLVDRDRLLTDIAEIGRMLHSMMNKASSFCQDMDSGVSEVIDEYFSENRNDLAGLSCAG